MTTKISFRDTSDIYSGCLNHIKSSLTSELPAGQTFTDNGLQGIVGSPEYHDCYNKPWQTPPTWIKISLGKYYIFPTAYGLMERRNPTYNHYLKGWSFFGRNHKGNWTLLSSYSNSQFSKGSFMIQMTQPDSEGTWALCLG